MSYGFMQPLEVVFFFVVVPFILLGVAVVLLRRPIQRLVNRRWGGASPRWETSRTFQISSGGAPDWIADDFPAAAKPRLHEISRGASGRPALTPDVRGRFEEVWALVRERFPLDPAGAVRDAHMLLHELLVQGGGPAILETQQEMAATDLSGVALSLSSMLETVRQTKETARTAERVLRGEEVDRAALHEAMEYYSAQIHQLLAAKA